MSPSWTLACMYGMTIKKGKTNTEEFKQQEISKEGIKGSRKQKETLRMIGAIARWREWMWNHYKRGQSIRFSHRKKTKH